MERKINPNLIRLAELTHNPKLKADESVLERQAEQPQENAPDLKGFVYVPSIGLYVAKERTLTGLTWAKTHKELKKQNLMMPTILQFREFLKYLRDSKKPEEQKIFNEIVEVRTPWRSEWLNARFEDRNGLYMISENVFVNGKYQDIEQKLDKYLAENRIPGISLDAWLNSNAQHGLPESKISKGDLYYWSPVSGYVAGFVAGSFRACLCCIGYPGYSVPSLGVFACAEGAVAKMRR